MWEQGVVAGSRNLRKLDVVLDEALKGTFPASDAFSVSRITGTELPSRPVDRKSPRLDVPARKVVRRKGPAAGRRAARAQG
jgi:hypothetical protein